MLPMGIPVGVGLAGRHSGYLIRLRTNDNCCQDELLVLASFAWKTRPSLLMVPERSLPNCEKKRIEEKKTTIGMGCHKLIWFSRVRCLMHAAPLRLMTCKD